MFYFEKFKMNLESRGFSAKTVKEYMKFLNKMKSHLYGLGIKNVKQVTGKIMKSYLLKLQISGISEATYYTYFGYIFKYFHFMEIEDDIFISPLNENDRPLYKRNRKPVISDIQMEEILEKIKTDTPYNIRSKTIIELAYSSALRPREIYNLKLQDIDYKKGILFIEQSKNRKDRLVPVGQRALSWLRKYITEVRSLYVTKESQDFVFITKYSGKPLTQRVLNYIISLTLKKNGLIHLNPYHFRFASATAMLKNGMSIAHISKMLGHSFINTTRIYLRISCDNLKKEFEQKHPRKKIEKRMEVRNAI